MSKNYSQENQKNTQAKSPECYKKGIRLFAAIWQKQLPIMENHTLIFFSHFSKDSCILKDLLRQRLF